MLGSRNNDGIDAEHLQAFARPFPKKKEKAFQEWLAIELPKRPEIQNVNPMFQRAAYEMVNRMPAFGLASVLTVTQLYGARYKAAIQNMKQGRALEYRNVRFRRKSFFLCDAAVQTTNRVHSQEDWENALAHANEVITELKQRVLFGFPHYSADSR